MLTDNFTMDNDYGAGKKELTVMAIKEARSTNTDNTGLEITYCTNGATDHPLRKTLWKGKFYNKFLASWLVGLGLNPGDLLAAVKNGQGDVWLNRSMPGRHGTFEYVETEKKNDKGYPYLEPKCKAELDLDAWIAEQKGKPNVPAPRQEGRQQAQTTPTDFPDDIPF